MKQTLLILMAVMAVGCAANNMAGPNGFSFEETKRKSKLLHPFMDREQALDLLGEPSDVRVWGTEIRPRGVSWFYYFGNRIFAESILIVEFTRRDDKLLYRRHKLGKGILGASSNWITNGPVGFP